VIRPGAISREQLLGLAGLCLLAAVLLYAGRATEFSGMSTSFTDSANRGEWHFFPHHLLYQPVISVLTRLTAPLGCDGFCAAQLHGIFWVIVTVASVYLVMLMHTRSAAAAFLTGLVVLFSHGIWVFATQAEPYAALVGVNALLLAIILASGATRWSRTTMAAVVVLFTFSLFLHQANVFVLIPLVVYLALVQGRAGLATAFRVTLVAGIASLGVFGLAYWLTQDNPNPRDFYVWLTYYGVISDDTHGTWEALLSLDSTRLLQTGRSVVATIITEPVEALRKPMRVLVVSLLAATALWNVVYAARRRRGYETRVLLLTWAGTFILFFAWWQASVHKFFLFSVVPLLLLLALTVSDLAGAAGARTTLRRAIAVIALTAVGAVATVNFQQSVRPLMGDGSGIERVSGKLAAALSGECVLYSKRRFGGYLGLVHGLDGSRDYQMYQMMYQSFHFGRFNPDMDRILGYSTDVNIDDCNIILLDWLSYDDFQWRTGRGMRRAPEATANDSEGPNWPEFIAWILDVQPAPDGVGVVHDELQFFRAGDDEAYVRINRRTRVRAESLNAVLEMLDQAIEQDSTIEFTRQEHRSLNRFRNRVFGYS
jgi:hypothetical protein